MTTRVRLSAFRPALAAGLAAALALAGCGPRGALTIYPDAAEVGSVQSIYVATSRGVDGGANAWAFARSEDLSFARFEVSVPPDRDPAP